jgi:hypothetical protein
MDMGKPGRFHRYKDDTAQKREEWFEQGLNALYDYCANEDGTVHRLAFPFGIGCGLAGGYWPRYRVMLENFAKRLAVYGVRVYIVRFLAA